MIEGFIGFLAFVVAYSFCVWGIMSILYPMPKPYEGESNPNLLREAIEDARVVRQLALIKCRSDARYERLVEEHNRIYERKTF